MAKTAYEVFGGPCHFDLVFKFFVIFTTQYAQKHNINQGNLQSETQKEMKRLENQFNKMFNPGGQYKLYPLPRCCSFHICIELKAAPANWNGKSTGDVLKLLPANTGLLVVDDLGMGDNPHADIGGQEVVIGDSTDAGILAHELGHILGLEDKFSYPGKTLNGGKKIPPHKYPKAKEEAEKRSLMGKGEMAGDTSRSITDDDVKDIIKAIGITCDNKKCCGGSVIEHPDPGFDGGENKALKNKVGCYMDSPTGAIMDLLPPTKIKVLKKVSKPKKKSKAK